MTEELLTLAATINARPLPPRIVVQTAVEAGCVTFTFTADKPTTWERDRFPAGTPVGSVSWEWRGSEEDAAARTQPAVVQFLAEGSVAAAAKRCALEHGVEVRLGSSALRCMGNGAVVVVGAEGDVVELCRTLLCARPVAFDGSRDKVYGCVAVALSVLLVEAEAGRGTPCGDTVKAAVHTVLAGHREVGSTPIVYGNHVYEFTHDADSWQDAAVTTFGAEWNTRLYCVLTVQVFREKYVRTLCLYCVLHESVSALCTHDCGAPGCVPDGLIVFLFAAPVSARHHVSSRFLLKFNLALLLVLVACWLCVSQGGGGPPRRQASRARNSVGMCTS